jgi:hypothetical protein
MFHPSHPFYKLRTNSIEQNPPGQAKDLRLVRNFSAFYVTQKCITVFTISSSNYESPIYIILSILPLFKNEFFHKKSSNFEIYILIALNVESNGEVVMSAG